MMFSKVSETRHPPRLKPVMVWDGSCSFCSYWIRFLGRFTGQLIHYAPYQEVSDQFPDIPVRAFQEAVQLIETDGSVYSGLDAAYRCFTYFKNPVFFLHRWYRANQSFAHASDRIYHFISIRRPLMYRLTVMFFGKDPYQLKPYLLAWIVGAALLFKTVGIASRRTR